MDHSSKEIQCFVHRKFFLTWDLKRTAAWALVRSILMWVGVVDMIFNLIVVILIVVPLSLMYYSLVTTGLMPCLGSPRVTLRKTAVHILQIYLRLKSSKA